MREPFDTTVAALEIPSPRMRAEAAATEADQETHEACLRAWPCLNTIEASAPPPALPAPQALTVAAWNIERCKRVEESAALIRQSGADLVLATEMDHGMARSFQRHTTRDLAKALGFGYVFGVEFVELGTGDSFETGQFKDEPNAVGLHGNAILSRYPLRNPCVVPLEDQGRWFTEAPKRDGQRRVGGRMAICATLDTAFGPVICVAVHYESVSDAAGRLAQTEVLLKTPVLSDSAARVVMGGDLNTAALAGETPMTCLAHPERHEPCFDAFRASGFEWQALNDGHPTTRLAPGGRGSYPLKRLDWLFARGLSAADARGWPAVSDRGDYLSDHEMITARIGP